MINRDGMARLRDQQGSTGINAGLVLAVPNPPRRVIKTGITSIGGTGDLIPALRRCSAGPCIAYGRAWRGWDARHSYPSPLRLSLADESRPGAPSRPRRPPDQRSLHRGTRRLRFDFGPHPACAADDAACCCPYLARRSCDARAAILRGAVSRTRERCGLWLRGRRR